MNLLEYLLTCLGEEGAEITKECSKANRFGLGDVGPDNKLNNRDRLMLEINDLIGTVQLMVAMKLLPEWSDNHAQLEKMERLMKWMVYAEQQGRLQLTDAQRDRLDTIGMSLWLTKEQPHKD